MEDVRKERQVKNEVLFRKLNERVQAVAEDLALDDFVVGEDREDYLCECADDTCFERVTLTRAEYERVRESAIQFVVVPGHVVTDIETVVEGHARFAVVQKDPGERTIAQATDPRA
jgi:hypothetical protein